MAEPAQDETLLSAYPLRIITPPRVGDQAQLEELVKMAQEPGAVIAMPSGVEVEHIPPHAFDMLLVDGECPDCGSELPRGSIVWKRRTEWWPLRWLSAPVTGRSGAWYYAAVSGACADVCQGCAAGVLLPWHEAQEQERRKARCAAARAAWLDPDGPEVRCACGHMVEQHCLDDEHCTWNPEEELGGRCLVADCNCYVCRPEALP